MLLYRVFPYRAGSQSGEDGHPLHVSADQGTSRWDNPDVYRAFYAAATPTGAIGERFAGVSTWTRSMLIEPLLPGAERALGEYIVDEDADPVLDLDDANALAVRSLRPSEIVSFDRQRTQAIARAVHAEHAWSGLTWWSRVRPEWKVFVFWRLDGIRVVQIESLVRHPALLDAATALDREVAPDIG